DRVGDDLPGTVKGDVPPAVALDDLDVEVAKLGRRGPEVARGVGGAAAVGDGGRMLDEQDGLLPAVENLGVDLLLPVPGGVVVEQVEVDDAHFRRMIRGQALVPANARSAQPPVQIDIAEDVVV